MKKLKEDIYAMEIAGVEDKQGSARILCTHWCGCGSIRTFYKVRLREEVFLVIVNTPLPGLYGI